ncbi:hypothetical protein pdam_00011100 [Pocillopora damicornis]|uniref:Uncharacterized protein n=1 Tax=Pocillopora damicornis TaxID=46731 RepID=A0A3M6U415_POCDA|nr:hypothetical protein pdam_00011100 [Pocillopora damicornis]
MTTLDSLGFNHTVKTYRTSLILLHTVVTAFNEWQEKFGKEGSENRRPRSPDKRVQLALWWKIMTEKRYQLKDKNHESKH